MKYLQYLLVIVFISQANNFSAQTLVQENRLWSNSMFGTEKELYWQNSNWIKFEGDTIINDTIFKVVYRSDDEFHAHWYRYGAIREDSVKKVYIHQNNKQSLLYDFNLNIGDSISDYSGSRYYYVTKVDSIELEYFENPLKRIYLSIWKNDESYTPWVEGIGSLEGILLGTKNIGTVGAVYNLVCFFENDTLKYKSEYQGSCFPQGYYESINSYTHNEYRVKVIYYSEFITFQFKISEATNAQLYVYELTGRSIGLFDVESLEKLDIPKDRLKKGFYIYYFIAKDHSEAGKFIVE